MRGAEQPQEAIGIVRMHWSYLDSDFGVAGFLSFLTTATTTKQSVTHTNDRTPEGKSAGPTELRIKEVAIQDRMKSAAGCV